MHMKNTKQNKPNQNKTKQTKQNLEQQKRSNKKKHEEHPLPGSLLSQDTSAFSLGFTALKTSALAMTISREIVRMVTSFQAMAGAKPQIPWCFFFEFATLFLRLLNQKMVGWVQHTGEKKRSKHSPKARVFVWGGGGCCVVLSFCWCFPSKRTRGFAKGLKLYWNYVHLPYRIQVLYILYTAFIIPSILYMRFKYLKTVWLRKTFWKDSANTSWDSWKFPALENVQ